MIVVFMPRMLWVNAGTGRIKVSVLALRNAQKLVTMDENRRELSHGTVLIEDNKIIFAGENSEAEQWLADQSLEIDKDIDASNVFNRMRLWWFAHTRRKLFVGIFPWLLKDELENVS